MAYKSWVSWAREKMFVPVKGDCSIDVGEPLDDAQMLKYLYEERPKATICRQKEIDKQISIISARLKRRPQSGPERPALSTPPLASGRPPLADVGAANARSGRPTHRAPNRSRSVPHLDLGPRVTDIRLPPDKKLSSSDSRRGYVQLQSRNDSRSRGWFPAAYKVVSREEPGIAGIYRVMRREWRNAQPVWGFKHYRLYATRTNYWMIANKEKVEDDFGCLCSRSRHQGKLPHKQGGWDRWSGKSMPGDGWVPCTNTAVSRYTGAVDGDSENEYIKDGRSVSSSSDSEPMARNPSLGAHAKGVALPDRETRHVTASSNKKRPQSANAVQSALKACFAVDAFIQYYFDFDSGNAQTISPLIKSIIRGEKTLDEVLAERCAAHDADVSQWRGPHYPGVLKHRFSQFYAKYYGRSASEQKRLVESMVDRVVAGRDERDVIVEQQCIRFAKHGARLEDWNGEYPKALCKWPGKDPLAALGLLPELSGLTQHQTSPKRREPIANAHISPMSLPRSMPRAAREEELSGVMVMSLMSLIEHLRKALSAATAQVSASPQAARRHALEVIRLVSKRCDAMDPDDAELLSTELQKCRNSFISDVRGGTLSSMSGSASTIISSSRHSSGLAEAKPFSEWDLETTEQLPADVGVLTGYLKATSTELDKGGSPRRMTSRILNNLRLVATACDRLPVEDAEQVSAELQKVRNKLLDLRQSELQSRSPPFERSRSIERYRTSSPSRTSTARLGTERTSSTAGRTSSTLDRRFQVFRPHYPFGDDC